MYRSFVRSCLALGALAASPGFAGVAHASLVEGGEIPSQLVNRPEPGDLNGACSKCRITFLSAAEGTTKDGATLELYYDDERGDLVGSLELTVLLAEGRYEVVTVDAVDLARGELAVIDLGDDVGWTWRYDVMHVWIEVVRSDA